MRVCYWSSILLMNRPRHFGKCHLERRRSFLLVSSPRVLFLALCPQLQLVALALSNIHPSTNLRHLPRRSRVVYIPAQSAVIGYAYTLLNPSIDSRSRASLGLNMEATALQQKPLANIRRGSRITDTGALQRQIPGAYLPSSDPSGPPVSSTQKNLVPVPHRERPPLVAAMAETAGSPIGIANVCCAHQIPSDSVLTARVAAKPAPQNRGQARCCLHDHGGW